MIDVSDHLPEPPIEFSDALPLILSNLEESVNTLFDTGIVPKALEERGLNFIEVPQGLLPEPVEPFLMGETSAGLAQ
jgi:hypothetical protein